MTKNVVNSGGFMNALNIGAGILPGFPFTPPEFLLKGPACLTM